MRIFQNFKIFLLTLILLSVACFFGTTERSVFAGTDDNVSGWAWNSGVGWISFNCTGDVDCSPDYGVKIEVAGANKGNFSGYAWNDNVGWISFNRSDTGNPPSNDPGSGAGPIAKADLDIASPTYNQVFGWAKILSMADNGWIRFDHGQTGEVQVVTDVLTGWAYNEGSSGMGIGWISFNCGDTAGLCATSDYKVLANLNAPPVVSELSAPNWTLNEACDGDALVAKLRWKYTDDSGNSGTAYRIQASGDGDSFDTGKCLETSGVTGKCTINFADVNFYCLDNDYFCSYTLNKTVFPAMDYNVNYNWTVTVWDDEDMPNDIPASGPAFTTYLSEFPDPDNFTWSPRDFNAGQQVLFESLTGAKYFTGSTEHSCDDAHCDWLWSSPEDNIDFNPGPTDASTTLFMFTTPAPTRVKLEITDTATGYSCASTTGEFNIKQKLPEWIETKK